MNKKITNVTTAIEPVGRGEFIVCRWLYNGKPRHMSVQKGADSVKGFHKEMIESLSEKTEPSLGNFGS